MPASTAKIKYVSHYRLLIRKRYHKYNVYLEDTVYLDNISLIKYSQERRFRRQKNAN